jgi:hypothetical protein
VPRHVAWLVVYYFAYTVHLGASARRTVRRQLARLTKARHRLLRPRRASGCLGTSRSSSTTTSPTSRVRVPWHVARLVVDYFAYTTRPGASACSAARHAARHRLLHLVRLVVDYFALCRLVSDYFAHAALPRAGSSSTTLPRAGPSSTTSPTPRVLVPRHVARLVVDHAPSHRSTSCRSVTLALAVRPIALSHGSTTLCAATGLVV